MERKIGEEVEVKLRIKVVETNNPCKGCIFGSLEVCPDVKALGNCSSFIRSDKKNVHFELVSVEELKEN